MKSVMISVKPKWCELIAIGKKTIEVRKTKPKCDVPFKCYIYCTKEKNILEEFYADAIEADLPWGEKGNGKIIGEFVCDFVETLDEEDLFIGLDEINDSRIEEFSCVDIDTLLKYKGAAEFIYSWHISDLKIYDKPKELKEFIVPTDGTKDCCDYFDSKGNNHCRKCPYFDAGDSNAGIEDDCCGVYYFDTTMYHPLFRPPQSWCYVEEVDG